MLISICGKEKTNLINQLKEIYKDKLLILDLGNIKFRNTIENEPVYYKMLSEEKCDKMHSIDNISDEFLEKIMDSIDKKHKKFNEYLNYTIYNKIKLLLISNQDKIIIFKRDEPLIPDVDKTEFFKDSDLKILVENNDEKVIKKSVFDKNHIYNKDEFDIVINPNEKVDVKKLVKI